MGYPQNPINIKIMYLYKYIQKNLCREIALGYREDKPLRKQLPSWPFEQFSVTK
jgi:hypothetical protein